MRTTITRAGAAAAILTLGGSLAPTVRACDFCLLSQGISPLETLNGAGLRLTQRYALNDSVYDGSDEIANPCTQEEFWTTEISGFYGIAEGLTLIASLPIRHTEVDGHLDRHEDGELELHETTGGDQGVGDLSVLARYTVFRHHTLDATTSVAVLGGVKFATGNTRARADDGDFLDAHVQLGTGSTDGLLGVSASYARGRLAMAANVLGGLANEGEAGDEAHSFGDWVNYDLTGRYRVMPGVAGASPTQVFAAFGVAGEARNRETEGGITVADSGGHTVYITPGVQFNFAGRWTAEVSYHHAVHHDFNGTQLGEDYKVFGSLTRAF